MAGENPKADEKNTQRRNDFWIWGLVLAILLFVGFVRFRLREMPLERDEGEYAYAGQLLLQGIPPYKLAYSMKFPGVLAAYALIMAVFGQTTGGIHLGFMLVNAAAIVLMFLLGRKLLGSSGGVIACATYALMSLSPSVLGFEAHATHFVVLFALGGMLLLLREPGRPAGWGRYCFSGLLFGLATLMKQPGLFFMGFGFLLLLGPELRARPVNWAGCLRRAAPFLFGGILPLFLTVLLLWRAGVFDRFWFWTVTCVRAYGATTSVAKGMFYLKGYFGGWAGSALFFWSLAALGLACLFFDRKAGPAKPFILGLLVFSVLGVSQGLYFRPHYFILMLPAVGLLTAAGLNFARRLVQGTGWPRLCQLVPAGIFCLFVALMIRAQGDFFFRISPNDACERLYHGHPFCESVEIARYIREHTASSDRIVVFGSEPQIYFYARRLSGTGYIYTYEMMQANPLARRMQEDMIREIKAAQPEMVVVIKCKSSWASTADSDNWIFNQSNSYWNDYYDLVGMVDLPPNGPTRYLWGAEAAAYVPGDTDCIFLLKRRPGRP